jgi:threonine/homoserine/homoserine lactone efflux protein
MNWNRWIRQTHRWLSIAFTLGFIVNGVAVAAGRPHFWMYFLALVPLFLLAPTGLYLFVLPYVAKGRVGQSAGG